MAKCRERRSANRRKMLKTRIAAILYSVCLIAASTTPAQVVVVKSGAQKWPISFSQIHSDNSAAAHNFLQTLQRDLEYSGWFAIAPPERSALLCRGEVQARGNRLLVHCVVSARAQSTVYLKRSYRTRVTEAHSSAHDLADRIVEALTGRRGIATTRIAFVGTRTGHKELYVCDYDGENLLQLTRDRSICVAPQWSPDRKRIYYTSYLKGYPDIYYADLVRRKRIRMVRFPGLNTGGAVSPDGQRMALVLSKDGNPDLYIMDMRTHQLTRLTHTPNAAEASPAWSPDGRLLAYVSDRSGTPQIYLWDSSTGESQRLRLTGSENVAPDWGPDGRLALASRFAGRYRIAVYDPRSGELTYLTAADADYEDPSWAPDGRHLAVTRTVGYRSQIFILDTMGDPPRRLTASPGDWYSPAWSP